MLLGHDFWTYGLLSLAKKPANNVAFLATTVKQTPTCCPPPILKLPLLCRWPTLNLQMINLPAEAVRGKTPILEDPHVSSLTHPVCVVMDSTSDLYTHNSLNDNTCSLSIFITGFFFSIVMVCCGPKGFIILD